MNPYAWDLARRLSSVAALAPIIVLAAVSGISGAAIAPAPANTAFTYYYDNPTGTLHLALFAQDESGRPVPEAQWTVQLASFNATNDSAIVPISAGVRGDSSGVAFLAENVPKGNYSITVLASNSAGQAAAGWLIEAQASDAVFAGPNLVQPCHPGFLQTTGGVEVFFAGPNDSSPRDYLIQYRYANSSTAFGPPSLSSPTKLGTMTGYGAAFPLSFPDAIQANESVRILVQVLATNGTVVASGEFSPDHFPLEAGPTKQAVSVGTYVIGILSFLIALVALGLGFLFYGRERSSGALDLIHAQPVTPLGVLITRFSAISLVASISALLSMVALQEGLQIAWATSLPTTVLLEVTSGLILEALALAGTILLICRLARGAGTILGAIAASFGVTTFAWTPIVLALEEVLAPSQPHSFVTGVGLVANPVAFPAISLDLAANGVFTPGGYLPVGSVGLGFEAVVIVGLLWTFGTVAVAGLLARRRD